jgi:hypothetical protein
MAFKCTAPGCSKRASFGDPGGQALSCAAHKLAGMVDVKNKKCSAPGCSKQPSFGEPGGRRALRCAAHKLGGMVNVSSKKCAAPGCSKRPSFGDPGGRKALRCTAHKLGGMVNVNSKKCAAPGCTKQASYGNPDERKALRCAAHRLGGMVNVKGKKCAAPGRTMNSSSGNPGGQLLRSAAHRLGRAAHRPGGAAHRLGRAAHRPGGAAHKLGSMSDRGHRRGKRRALLIGTCEGRGGAHKASRMLGTGWDRVPPAQDIRYGASALLTLCEMAERELYGRHAYGAGVGARQIFLGGVASVGVGRRHCPALRDAAENRKIGAADAPSSST